MNISSGLADLKGGHLSEPLRSRSASSGERGDSRADHKGSDPRVSYLTRDVPAHAASAPFREPHLQGAWKAVNNLPTKIKSKPSVSCVPLCCDLLIVITVFDIFKHCAPAAG